MVLHKCDECSFESDKYANFKAHTNTKKHINNMKIKELNVKSEKNNEKNMEKTIENKIITTIANNAYNTCTL